MAESYSVEAVLKAVDAGFSSTFKSIANTADQIGDSFGHADKPANNFISTVGKIASAIGVVKVVDDIGNGIKEMGSELSESSAAWKTFDENMKGLGKSSSQVNSVQKSLQSFAVQTIYSASDMASTYSQLAAVGTKNTTKLVEGFGGLAAAASDPQQAMKTLSEQATQMAAKPTVQWEDFKLMLEQTPAGIAAVAKTMGESTSQLVSDIQNGKIKTQDLFDAIAKTGTNKTFTKMATQYKTVGQAMDGLKETLTTKLQPSFDKMSQVGINAISKLADYIGSINFSGITNNILSSFQGMTTKFQPLVLNIKTLFSNVFQGININSAVQMFNAVKTIASNTVNGIIGILNGLVVAAEEVWSSVSSGFSKAFSNTNFSQITNVVSGIFTNLSLIVQTNIGVIAGIISSLPWGSVFNALKIGVEIVIGALSGLSKIMVQLIQNPFFQTFSVGAVAGLLAYAAIIKTITTAMTVWSAVVKIGTAIQAAFNAVMALNPFVLIAIAIIAVTAALVYFFTQTQLGQQIWSEFTSFLSSAWQNLVSLAQSVWNAIALAILNSANAVKNGWDAVQSFFSNLWESISSVTHTVWSSLVSFLSSLWSSVGSMASSLWNNIKSTIISVVIGIKNAVSGTFNNLLAAVSSIWNNVKSITSSVWNGIKSTVTNLATGLVSGVKKAWSGISSIASSIWSGVKSAITGALHFSLWDAGKAIMNSFFRGLKSVWSSVTTFVGHIAGWIKAHKGPISYDKRLLIPAGNAIMNGLNSGLVNSFSSVQDTINGMSSQIADAFNITPSLNTSPLASTVNGLNGRSTNLGVASTMTMKDSTLQMQNNALLRQIANKDGNVYMSNGRLVGAIGKDMDEELGARVGYQSRWKR